MPRSSQAMGPRLRPPGRSTIAHSAGERVSALTAEISIATLMVTANWRNRLPEMPGMNATGTNTESSTSVMAMIGPVICRIALSVASAGERCGSSSSTRSTFSTTTMASSTTMPIASTMARSDTVLAEYPSASIAAKVPMRLTGTATAGMIVARRLPRKTKTTSTTRRKAWPSVFITSWIVSCTKSVES